MNRNRMDEFLEAAKELYGLAEATRLTQLVRGVLEEKRWVIKHNRKHNRRLRRERRP